MSPSSIPITIITLLSLFSVSLANIIGSSTTYAEGSSVSLSVDNSDTVLELTVPSSVSLDLTPNSANNYTSFGTTDLVVSAGTNNPTGYTLTMSVPSTNLVNSSITLSSSNNPNHIPLDNSNHPIIPTITSTYSGSNFPDNAWGYRLSTNTDYSPIPSTLELANTNIPGNAIPISLDLAAKINSSQPAGKYTTTFNFAVVSNAPIYTLADFLADIENAEPGDTITLLGDVDGNSAYLEVYGKALTINGNDYSLSNFSEIHFGTGTYNNVNITNNDYVDISGNASCGGTTFTNNNQVSIHDFADGVFNNNVFTDNGQVLIEGNYGAIFSNTTFSENDNVYIGGGSYSYLVIGVNTQTALGNAWFDHLSLAEGINSNNLTIGINSRFYPLNEPGYLSVSQAENFVNDKSLVIRTDNDPTVGDYFFVSYPPIDDIVVE